MSRRFSVVIPTYNRWATLRQTLTALQAQTWPAHEIIVVDDGSQDETARALPAHFPAVRYLRQANAGPATARNRGIAEATGEMIAFTDDDCLPPADWLARLADGFQRHPEVTGVGGRLLAPAHVQATNLLAQYEAYTVIALAGANDTEIRAGFDCPAGGTNNIGYRREALRAVQGFDTQFPYAAGEDADLKWRLAQNGAQFLYVPLTVWHLQPYTWPAFRKQHTVRGKGVIYFNRKWGGAPSYGRIMARGFYGLARAFAQWPRYPSPALLRPAIEETLYNTRGQWLARQEITL
jgi:GT2 family glycosyltransferase